MEEGEGQAAEASIGPEPAMMAMFKMLMEEQQRAELAREHRAEIAREESRQREEADRRTLQEEYDRRQHDNNMAVLRAQQEMGEQSSRVNREFHEQDKRRDRVLFGMPMYKEGEDLEEYFSATERRMVAAKLPQGDWQTMLDARFSGRVAVAWRDITSEELGFQEAKNRLLKSCGYTPKVASDAYYGFRPENCRGLTADQLYSKGQQLLRRLVAPAKLAGEAEFSLLKGWIYAVVPRRARAALDARSVEDVTGLIGALQDFLAVEGEKGEGQTATFKKGAVEGREKSAAVTCFKCGRVGHKKASDCWGAKAASSSRNYGAGSAPGAVPMAEDSSVAKVVCYSCGIEGHKSPQCPSRGERPMRGAKPKSVKRIWHVKESCIRLDGKVNDHETPILLDTGASVSVVLESMIRPENLTGETVLVNIFGADKSMSLPVATVPFEIGELRWKEKVAVFPVKEGTENEVIYNWDIRSKRGKKLVELVDQQDGHEEVNLVTTRARSKAEAAEAEQEAITVAKEGPTVKPCVVSRQDVTADSELEVEDEIDCLDDDEEESEVTLGIEREPSVNDKEEKYVLKQDSKGKPDLEIPCITAGGSRQALIEDTKIDPTLLKWREYADKGERGLFWKDGLLFQSKVTHTDEVEHVLVLPEKHRKTVMEVAHDGLQHMGARRVKALLGQRFSWPGLGQEVIQYVKSCEICRKCSKLQKKVPMVERQVMSEPFESMAVDIVGPFPKGKGGCRFLLTCICMASRWPEALPLTSITARSVVIGLIEIFSRTGIPLELLSDQGAQFIGKVVTQLCKSLNIQKLKTTPYHPQTNGIVERLHGTLGAMLTKAASQGLDWVGQIPFALFALRAAPNRETLFSPYELVFGRQVGTPLDIIHQGWVEVEFEDMDMDEWAGWLKDRLECWHEVMRARGDQASKKRKTYYDKKAVERELAVGDMVLCRIPGMAHKLRESWKGPFEVVKKLNQVDYRIDLGRKKSKVLHINNLKQYQEREEVVLRIAVIAEDVCAGEELGLKMDGICKTFDSRQVARLKDEFPNVFCDLPGRTDVCQLKIHTGEAQPIALCAHRLPDKYREKVKQELDKLLEIKVIEPSHSPWASPIVPVPKPDGSIRLCIDYRRLNSITRPDPYYMITLDEILERVGSSGCLSKLDLSKGYYQIGIVEEDQEKTAFVTQFGKYSFSRMPFGLRNAPAIFQRLMEEVLRGCYQWAAPYIDDILVYSQEGCEHIEHLRMVLQALGDNGLTLKSEKCVFGKTHLEYLGHWIGCGTVAVPEHRATAMAEYLKPRTKKQLRSFLGAVSYYRRFVLNLANHSAHLSPHTSKLSPTVVVWTEVMMEAFQHLRVSLVELCVLTIPSQRDCFRLHSDASGLGVGATLNVVRDGADMPVAFYSKQLQGAQRFYSATELELLAIFLSIQHFDHFLVGTDFVVVTDHKALIYLLHSKKLNRRLYGWMLKLMDFTFSIVYRAGEHHQDADGLSRQAWSMEEFGAHSDWEISSRQPRAAEVSFVGGDVGITPLEKEEGEDPRRPNKDVKIRGLIED